MEFKRARKERSWYFAVTERSVCHLTIQFQTYCHLTINLIINKLPFFMYISRKIQIMMDPLQFVVLDKYIYTNVSKTRLSYVKF